MNLVSVFLGLITLFVVARGSKPTAASGRRAVWRSIAARQGSFFWSEAGWLGYWTTVPDGEIVNELTPPY